MSLRHTKMNENNATIFHSYPCFFLSVFPLSVAIFSGVPHDGGAHQDVWAGLVPAPGGQPQGLPVPREIPAKTRYSFWRRSRFRTLPTGLRGKPGTTSNRSGSL